MADSLFMNADEVADVLGVSKSYAYKLIKRLNDEQSEKGLLVIHGKLNREYLNDKIYKSSVKEGK